MSELTIQAAGFLIQPLVNLPDGSAEIRWYYNRPFLTSDGTQVQWGTGTTGFWVTTPCSIASGLVTVDQDTLLWSTDDAQDPSPATISLSAALYSSQGQLLQRLTIIGKAQWIVPSSLAPTTTWPLFSNYNQALTIYGAMPDYFYTAAQIDRLVRQWLDANPASETLLGTVLTSTTPSIPDSPVAWITDDPLVRDAIKIQGIDVDDTPPLDSQVLIYNEANGQYEPGNQAAGTGNVVSNEVTSVDGEMTVFSGTGGKTIKRYLDDGLVRTTAGVAAPGTVATADIDDEAVTYAKIQDVADDRLLGRSAGSAGPPQEITVGTGLDLSAGVLSNTVTDTGITQLTGDVTAGPGSGSQAATIPNDTVTYAKMQPTSAPSVLLGRGDSGAGDVQEISLGSGLSMTGTTLAASGTGGYDTVEDEGTPLTQRSTLDFQGAGVSAADAGGKTVVTIPGGGGSTSFAGIDKFSNL